MKTNKLLYEQPIAHIELTDGADDIMTQSTPFVPFEQSDDLYDKKIYF